MVGFEENQNTAAQVIGGMISLIPVLDQVIDVSGSLYNVIARGGFKNASTDQLVSFGFAAFGVTAEVGSAFKTVFKPRPAGSRLLSCGPPCIAHYEKASSSSRSRQPPLSAASKALAIA